MKKGFALLLSLVLLLPFTACGTHKIDIGTRDGVIYFNHSGKAPEVTLRHDDKIVIEDSAFFEKLVSCIDGKPAKEDTLCNCVATYVVEIEKYDFSLHSDHILIYSPMGHNIKGVNITYVECTKQEMNGLFDILDSVCQDIK
ncbi:MAG: hypothetical protein E7678_08310 [Ruminococcaceae bacterium]|nr:hypothetical protein [Oscillospiraceae bacterium]